MINLQYELNKWLKTNFDWCIVRHLTDEKCTCWRVESNTPNPECPTCEGAGYIFNEFLWKCKIFSFSQYGVMHLNNFHYGQTYQNIDIIYFPVTDDDLDGELNCELLSQKDILYEIKTNINGSIIDPIHRSRKWEISDVYFFNMEQGQREFYKAFAKPLNDQ